MCLFFFFTFFISHTTHGVSTFQCQECQCEASLECHFTLLFCLSVKWQSNLRLIPLRSGPVVLRPSEQVAAGQLQVPLVPGEDSQAVFSGAEAQRVQLLQLKHNRNRAQKQLCMAMITKYDVRSWTFGHKTKQVVFQQHSIVKHLLLQHMVDWSMPCTTRCFNVYCGIMYCSCICNHKIHSCTMENCYTLR